MRYTFPHHTPEPEFIQPDYRQWSAVQVGMTRDEVIALLGPPHDEEFFRGIKPGRDDTYWYYGYLQMPMLPHPRTYSFLIGFDDDGLVFIKADPFGGRLSPDGVPTVPEIITPVDRTIFTHYPRIVDMRWYPSSGVYPITYAVELGHGAPHAYERFFDQLYDSNLPVPFLMINFVGNQTGRFRVKAKNELGESDWSEHRYFEFTA